MADLSAQTGNPTPNFQFTGALDAQGRTLIRADWSTDLGGSDLFSTSPVSVYDNPAVTGPLRFNLTISADANLYATNSSGKDGLGIINATGPGTGVNNLVTNYGNLNAYAYDYPTAGPVNAYNAVQLNHADLVNYGVIGTLTGKVGWFGTSGYGSGFTVNMLGGAVTNYGIVSGQNALSGGSAVSNYGHVFARFGKGLHTQNSGGSRITNYSDAGVQCAYLGSYGIEGVGGGGPAQLSIWNNWGYVSWFTSAISPRQGYTQVNDYGGPLVPGALSFVPPADGGCRFDARSHYLYAPANSSQGNNHLPDFNEFDLVYNGSLACQYDDAFPFATVYGGDYTAANGTYYGTSSFNGGVGAAMEIDSQPDTVNLYNTVYTVTTPGRVTPAGTKLNYLPILHGVLFNMVQKGNHNPVNALALHFDHLSPSEVQAVQAAVDRTSLITDGIVGTVNGQPRYLIPRGRDYLNYFKAGGTAVDSSAGGVATVPGHTAWVSVEGAVFSWSNFLDVTFTHQDDLAAEPLPGVFAGSVANPVYYRNPAGSLPAVTVTDNVAGTYQSSGQSADAGSTLSHIAQSIPGATTLGSVVSLQGQLDLAQNGLYALTAAGPGTLVRLRPAWPPAALSLDDAGALLSGSGSLAGSLTAAPGAPALDQGTLVQVTRQPDAVQNGFYHVASLTGAGWSLVRSSFLRGFGTPPYVTNASLTASYQTTVFRDNTANGQGATLTNSVAGPLVINAPVGPGDLVLVLGRSQPGAAGLYLVVDAGGTSTPWRLLRLQRGFGVQTVTTADLGATYAASANPGAAGSTLTAAGNGPLSLGVELAPGDGVLVNAQSTAAQNGCYQVSAPGDGSHPWVLTRPVLTAPGTTPTAASEAAALRSLICPVATSALGATVFVETTAASAVGSTPVAFGPRFVTGANQDPYERTTPTTVTLTGSQGLVPGLTTNVQAGWTLQLGSQAAGNNSALTNPAPSGAILLDAAVAQAAGYSVDGNLGSSRPLAGTLVVNNGLFASYADNTVVNSFVPNAYVQTTHPEHQVGTGTPNDARLYVAPPPVPAPAGGTPPVFLPEISGAGDLVQQGTGTTTLTGSMTGFAGHVYVAHGTLVLSAGTSLAASSGVTMDAWDPTISRLGLLDCSRVGGGRILLRSLQGHQGPFGTGAGDTTNVPAIELGANSLVLGSAPASSDPPTVMVYQGQISGAGGLELLAGVDLTLGGSVASANVYAGDTLVDAGAILRLSTFPKMSGTYPMLGTGHLTNNGSVRVTAGNTQDGGAYANYVPIRNAVAQGADGAGGNHLVFAAKDYVQGPGGELVLKLNGRLAGAGGSFGPGVACDSLLAGGTISLQPGAKLTLTEAAPIKLGKPCTLVVAQGAAVRGTFAGLPEGAVVAVGLNNWTIHYAANQITLSGPSAKPTPTPTPTAVPAPTATPGPAPTPPPPGSGPIPTPVPGPGPGSPPTPSPTPGPGTGAFSGPGAPTTATPVAAAAAPDGPVLAFAPSADGKLVIAGAFTSLGGQPRRGVARLNADGTLDPSFDPGSGADDTVRALLVLPNGGLVVAGDFASFDGQPRSGLARLDRHGRLKAAFTPQLDGRLAPPADAPGPALAANDPAASLRMRDGRSPWAPGFVSAVALVGSHRLLVAGAFARADGQASGGLALVSLKLGRLRQPGFNRGLDGPVRALVAQAPGGGWLVAGDFTSYGGRASRGVAALGADGSLQPAFASLADAGGVRGGSVYALRAWGDGSVVLAGDFTGLGGQPVVGGLARLDQAGRLDGSFALNPAGAQAAGPALWAVDLVRGGQVLVGGPAGRVVRLQPDGSLDARFGPTLAGTGGVSADGPISALRAVHLRPAAVAAAPGGAGADQAWVAGAFTSLDDQSRSALAVLDDGVSAEAPALVSLQLSKALMIGGGTLSPGQSAALVVRRTAAAATIASMGLQPGYAVGGSARPGRDYTLTGGGQRIVRLRAGQSRATVNLRSLLAPAGVGAAPTIQITLQPGSDYQLGWPRGIEVKLLP